MIHTAFVRVIKLEKINSNLKKTVLFILFFVVILFSIVFLFIERATDFNKIEQLNNLQTDPLLLQQFPIIFNEEAGNFSFNCNTQEIILKPIQLSSNVDALVSSKCVYLDEKKQPQSIIVPVVIESYKDNIRYIQLLGGFNRQVGNGIYSNARFLPQAIANFANVLGIDQSNKRLLIIFSAIDMLKYSTETSEFQFTKPILIENYSVSDVMQFAKTGNPSYLEITKHERTSVILPISLITPQNI